MNESLPPSGAHHAEASGAAGILLANLGTPDAPTPRAVRRYLKEFLSDPRIVDLPRWLWWPVLHGIILNTRPKKSASAYARIWTAEGSPLLCESRKLCEGLETELRGLISEEIHVVLGMRYGNPSIGDALRQLRQKQCRHLLVFPLFPQYSATTTASVFDAVAAEFRTWPWIPDLRLMTCYHDHPAYIEALAEQVRAFWDEQGRPDRLLLSFHGIPERYFAAGDPYPCHCRKTSRLLAAALDLDEEHCTLAFQSRFGRQPWVTPYTDATLRRWASEGVEKVDVFCPGFAVDCLETLEEIGMQGREIFIAAGGRQLRYIPALNDSARHVRALADIAAQHLAGWG